MGWKLCSALAHAHPPPPVAPYCKSSTHRILAWKAKGGSIVGRDDDGETGAGDRILFLFDRIDVDNVAVVVVRWMNGPHIGAARFKLISTTANQVLNEHFRDKQEQPQQGKKKK